MGKISNTVNYYFSDNKRFADLFNAVFFQGTAVVDYTMPFRCLQYDTMEYGKQLDEIRRRNEREGCLGTRAEVFSGLLKQDRLEPVYTLCLYHGEEK